VPPSDSRRGTLAPTLAWALLHAPLFLALFAPQIVDAVAAAPAPFRAALWPTFAFQAALLALLPWLLTAPLARWPRVHRVAAPAASALLAAVVVVDSQVHQAVGFHLNGFLLDVLRQPTGLSEVGLTPGAAALVAAVLLAAVLADAALGASLAARRPSARRTLPVAAALVLLGVGERIYGQVLAHYGGPALFAAAGVLPLQVPVRMGGILRAALGKHTADPLALGEAPLPPGVPPEAIRFTRTPDVLFVLAESLPHTHLDARTMPNLWRRAEGGARFTRHYAGASATSYSVFSTFYALQARKLEAVVGSGRHPLVFDAFRANGYRVQALAASCVDWMNLKQTVFGGLSGALETWCDAPGLGRDLAMSARALEIARETPRDRPLFLFLFYDGTHFSYPRDDRDAVFQPEWDGAGALRSARAPPEQIRNRARNAARTVDRVLDGLIGEIEAARGAPPLVVFTGDHGEEFRQKGHLGHGSDVTDEQIHVPLVIAGPGVAPAVRQAPTSHVDLVPTLFALLGDRHPPELYSDGMDAFEADAARFVLATVGWEPRYAAIGEDLKVRMTAGLPAVDVTDPDDRPLPDGAARAAARSAALLRALRGGKAR